MALRQARRAGGRARRITTAARPARQQLQEIPVEPITAATQPQLNTEFADIVRQFQANQARATAVEQSAADVNQRLARIRMPQTMPGQTVGTNSSGGVTRSELSTIQKATAPYRPIVQMQHDAPAAPPQRMAINTPANNPRAAAARLHAVNTAKFATPVAGAAGKAALNAAASGHGIRGAGRAAVATAKNAAYRAAGGWALGAIGGATGGLLGGPVGAASGAGLGQQVGSTLGPVFGEALERGVGSLVRSRSGGEKSPMRLRSGKRVSQPITPETPGQRRITREVDRRIRDTTERNRKPRQPDFEPESPFPVQRMEPNVEAGNGGTRRGNLGPQGGFVSRIYQGNLSAFDDMAPSGVPLRAKPRTISTLAPAAKLPKKLGRGAVNPISGLPFGGVRARAVARAMRMPPPAKSAQLVY